jgi:hypothetical protein
VRHGLALAAAAGLLLGVPHSTAADRPGVEVAVRATVRPDPEDSNPLGRRQFLVRFSVGVNANQTCDRLRLAYRYRILFDGRLDQGFQRRGSDEARAVSSAVFTIDVGFGPTAGETVPLETTGECVTGAAIERSRRVTHTARIPPHSCKNGPLRVLRLRGTAAREDLTVTNKLVPLRRGDFVLQAYTAWLARRSRIVFGARQCNGFRIALKGTGAFFPGSYARSYYGSITGIGFGMKAQFAGDQHAGGIETENAVVAAAGRRFGPRRVSSFDVYSYPRRVGRLTSVRVLRGAAWVAGGPGAGALSAPIRVAAGYKTIVRCSSYRRCRPDEPRPL